jgi:hypothetical protein
VNNYAFDRTVLPVKMERTRIDRFRWVVLNFKNVNQIGQACADGSFRVFTRRHPGKEVQFINANGDISNMILRAQSA